MVVLGVLPVIVGELPELAALAVNPRADREPAGHAKVDGEHLTAVQVDEDVFRAAVEPLHASRADLPGAPRSVVEGGSAAQDAVARHA
jgi:hypothetical protein